MKKFYVTMFLIAGVSGAMHTNAQKGFSLSLKAIPQLTFLHNSDDNDNNTLDKQSTFKAGFGIGAGYNFNNNMGIALDVLYSLQGQNYDVGTHEVNRKLSYVKIPVLFSYNTNPARPVSFIGKIGPQLSILTTGKIENENGTEIVNNAEDIYESVTIGGAISAGVQFKLSSQFYLGTSLRFDYDFSNAEDEDYPTYPVGRASTHNMTTGLEIGIRYVLK